MDCDVDRELALDDNEAIQEIGNMFDRLVADIEKVLVKHELRILLEREKRTHRRAT